jgi:multiple sugar transport system ATP-binding protein
MSADGRARYLGFALRMKRMERSSIVARVSAAARRLGLSDLVARRPRQLSGGQRVDLVVGDQRLRLPAHVPDPVLAQGESPVVVGIRPEALRSVSPGTDDEHVLQAPVVLVESLGPDLLVHAELDAPAVLTEDRLEMARELGGDPAAEPARARITARLTPDVRAAAGDRARMDVDVERLHFFDPETTLALR